MEATKRSIARAVKTVPPSAQFEPPSPSDAAPRTLHDEPGPSVRRPRIRSSSSGSSDGTSDYDTTDEEPPWWTFTSRGMAKMRARARRLKDRDGHDKTASSGDDKKDVREPQDKVVRRKRSAVRSKERASEGEKDKDKDKGRRVVGRKSRRNTLSGPTDQPTQTRPPPARHQSAMVPRRSDSPAGLGFGGVAGQSGSQTPRTPASSSHQTGIFFRRSAFRDSPKSSMSSKAPPMRRSTSAPSSPIRTASDPPLQHVLSTLDDAEGPHVQTAVLAPGIAIPDLTTKTPGRMYAPRAKRLSTTPNFRKFRRRNTEDGPTDSEPSAAERPRPVGRTEGEISGSSQKKRRRVDEGAGESSNDTPSRPRNTRRSSNLLKIQLPPPFYEHFARGWTHAGTWQDAYYGFYEDGTPREDTNGSNEPRVAGVNDGPRFVATPRTLSWRHDSQEPVPEESEPEQEEGIQETPNARPVPERRRSKRSRKKRYRTAMVPPTPSGLGFTPTSTKLNGSNLRTESNGDHGFDWGDIPLHSNMKRNNGDAMDEERIARFDTGLSENPKAEPMTHTTLGPFRRRWARRKERRQRRVKEESWSKRWRRMIFLDARVTIWIRLWNLAVVVAALGLAVTIRLRLIDLGLPGTMGSSTTLIISFASFTTLHVLTAIYREYYGKPIGLWGLRSKMLWVCLDLLFVALWSSASSDTINDFFSTPLMCTAGRAWWVADIDPDDDLVSAFKVDSSTWSQLDVVLSNSLTSSGPVREVCRRQVGCFCLSLIALLLYGGNMVLSLFRIFETVRRTANLGKGVVV